MVRILCLVLLVIVASTASSDAQDSSKVAAGGLALTPATSLDYLKAAGSVPVVRPLAVPEAVMELKMSKSGNVSLDFREADIKNVLKVLSYKSGINIIAGPEVVGQVNIQLKDVPWQKALEVILSTYGYSYEQKGSIIMVTTIEILKKRREDNKTLADQEPLATETFVLNFSKAEDVVKSLEKMKTGRGSINQDMRTNAVIVTDVGSNLELIKNVIKTLDTVTPQVLIEARIIETTLDKNDNLGLLWGTSVSASGGIRSTTLPWANSARSNLFPTGATTQKDSGTTAPVYGTLNAAGLSATLNLLKTRNNSKTLSNPQIVTLDNQPAKVQVGYQYPMPQYTSDAQTGTLHISGWNYMDIGLVFDVTPHINNAHLVTLDIAPKIIGFKSQPSSDEVKADAATMQILTNESVSTKVMIQDGETLVIAGLVTDKVSKNEVKVPVLGYIPFLGRLFQHTADVHTKTELTIFLTPHIITPVMDTTGVFLPGVAGLSEAPLLATSLKPGTVGK